LDQQAREEEDNPGFIRNIATNVADFFSDRFTDDFSALPVVGAPAKALGETLQTTWDGTYALASSGALAANPKYWENRGQNADLFADARNTNVGDAAVAASQFVGSTPIGAGLGVLNVPAAFGENIYDKNPNLNIADKAQRDVAFTGRTDLNIQSGLTSGVVGWFLDPLVVVGKASKVARFGTTFGGLEITGLTQRTIRDQKGFSEKVFKTIDGDTDDAIAFAKTGLGKQSRIGVIAQQVADGDYESLKRINAFGGSNRDTLASVGAGIDNTEDAAVFLAAASGSAKYQKILAENMASVDLALKRAKSGGVYETAALNVPVGTTPPVILKGFLEPGVDAAKVIEDLTKRDKALRNALIEVTENPTGMVERLGGQSVTGMKIAQAWRDGVMSRSRFLEKTLDPLATTTMRNADVTARIAPRYGTGPAVFETIYQISGAMPRVAVLDWIKGSHSTGWIDIRGLSGGKGSDELDAVFSETKNLAKDRVWVSEQQAIYAAAMGPMQRSAAIRKIEENAFQKLAADEGIANPEMIKELYAKIDKVRNETVQNFKNQNFGIDPTDGTTIIGTPLFISQLETKMPMLNMRMMEKAAKMAKKWEKYGGVTDIKRPGAATASTIDSIMSMWKAGALLRFGYTVRNTAEGWARSAVYLGTIPGADQLQKTAGRSLFNNARRLEGKMPRIGTKAISGREKKAMNELDELRNDVTALREKVSKDPTGSSYDVNAVAKELGAKEKAMNELQLSLDALAAKQSRLTDRKYLGDDGAFGGDLNSELGDLYRKLSSAQATNRQFLQSRYSRKQNEMISQSNWGTVKPTDTQYWDELSSAARQMRNDEVGLRLLNGESIGDIVAYLRSNKGRTYRRDMTLSKEAVERRVVQMDDMIKMYLPTEKSRILALSNNGSPDNFRSALATFTRNKPPKEPKTSLSMTPDQLLAKQKKYEKDLAAWNKRSADQPMLADIHGRQTADKIQGNWYHRNVDRPIEYLFKVLGTYPESTLVRHPFYNEVWSRTFSQLQSVAKVQGRKIDEDLLGKINTSAHKKAMQATNETLFTIERYSNPAAAMRWASPFFAAWENSAKVWTRLVVNDPSILARANLLWNAPAQLGMIVDNEGNPVEGTAFDFLTGSEDQFITLPAGLDDAMTDYLGGMHVRIPRASFNVITPGNTAWLPGFGPMVVLPVGVMLGGIPDKQKILRDALGDQLYEQVAPFGQVNNTFMEAFAPAWVRNEYVRWEGEGNADYVRTANAMMQIAMVDWYKSGGAIEDKPDMDLVLSRTNDFYRWTSAARLTLPVSTSRSSPNQIEVDEWRRLKVDPSLTWNEKVEQFITKYPDLSPLTVSGSDSSIPGLQSSQEVYSVLTDHGDLARSFAASSPESVGILASSAPVGVFDQGVFKWMTQNKIPGISDAFRGAKNPADMQKDIVMSRAWRDYTVTKENRDAAMADLGIKSMESKAGEGIKRMWDQYVNVTMVQQYGKDWTNEYGSYQDQTVFSLTAINEALGDKKFMKDMGSTPRWQGIATYMSTREAAIAAIRNGADSAAVKEMFNVWVADFKFSSLEFNDFYERYLEQDDISMNKGIGALNG
jgi:hypothetical protein